MDNSLLLYKLTNLKWICFAPSRWKIHREINPHPFQGRWRLVERKSERDFHGKRCVRSRKATTSPLPGRRKCLLVRKGSVFPSGGGGIKAARDQSGIGGAIRWAHNASIPTPPILPPVKGFSIIEEMAKAVYRRRLVHFSRGWIERGRKDWMKTRAPIDLRILFVSNVTRLDDDKSYVNHPSYICLLMAFRATNCKISEILMNERYSLRGIELWKDWRVSNNDENSNEL